MPRPAVPTLCLVAIVLVAGCAPAEVPQGFSGSSLPATTTGVATPDATPAPPSTTPPSATPSAPTPAPSVTPSAAAMDVQVFLDDLQGRVAAQGSWSITNSTDFPEGLLSFEVRVDQREEPARSATTVQTPDVPRLETIVVGDQVWVRGESLAGPDTWVAADGSDPDDPLAEYARSAVSDTLGDGLDVMRAAATSVEVVGTTDVDGATLVRHAIAIDPAAASAAAPAGSLTQQAFAMEQGEFVYDMWLDEEGLPRILGFTLDALPIRVRYDDWGEDQGIAPPDPATVVTAPPDTPTTVPSATPGG